MSFNYLLGRRRPVACHIFSPILEFFPFHTRFYTSGKGVYLIIIVQMKSTSTQYCIIVQEICMLTVGDTFPGYSLKAVVSREPGKEFANVTEKTYADKWQVVFFWPRDFTFVCPTEIAEFGKLNAEFEKAGAQVLGASTDGHYVHLAWRNEHPDLKDLPFPMLADARHELSSALGILHKTEGVALRATFIVDPDGIIQWVTVNGLDVGRNIPETLRVLKALQSGELTPCNWETGQETLTDPTGTV